MCLDECQVDWDSLIAPPCQNSKCQSRHIITKGAGWVVWVDWLQGKLRKLNLALACCSSHPQVWEKLFLNIFALWSLFYSSCRFLLSSASLSEESLCRVCGKKKIISLCVVWITQFPQYNNPLIQQPWGLREMRSSPSSSRPIDQMSTSRSATSRRSPLGGYWSK